MRSRYTGARTNAWATRRRTPSTTIVLPPEHVFAVTARPMSPLQALMECEPGQEPDTSRLELLALRDVLEDAIQTLPELQRFVFNECIVGRSPLRSWEPLLAKTTVARARDAAIRHLRLQLQDHPLIIEHLEKNL